MLLFSRGLVVVRMYLLLPYCNNLVPEPQLASFDVRKATCTMQKDTSRLLACIESGFGSYTAFNEVMHKILEAHEKEELGESNPDVSFDGRVTSHSMSLEDAMFQTFASSYVSASKPLLNSPTLSTIDSRDV